MDTFCALFVSELTVTLVVPLVLARVDPAVLLAAFRSCSSYRIILANSCSGGGYIPASAKYVSISAFTSVYNAAWDNNPDLGMPAVAGCLDAVSDIPSKLALQQAQANVHAMASCMENGMNKSVQDHTPRQKCYARRMRQL